MSQKIIYKKPAFRRLRGYAFDPITSLDMDTAQINEITYKIPWEPLDKGPEGEYIIVFDRDPESDAIYAPVDLEQPTLLASDGLPPSQSNPQFHQQMVYAVVMSTIKTFERALGRKVIWSPREVVVKTGGKAKGKKAQPEKTEYHYVPKLLVYPHGIRDQNAYYSPERKALVFGYYNATPKNSNIFLPGGIVYSCLSHDIVAHETTHALLDSMYSRYMETTNPDVGGFHEGFADTVALLQHFMHPEILRNQIAHVRGDLDAENLLSKLAVEFGKSTGDQGSLRDAIGTIKKGKWKKQTPSTRDYATLLECHDRGGLLISAIFDAFTAIYKTRTCDLLSIATSGTGILPPGNIHPDLVDRLVREAAKTARHILNMCVRALDYCPPVDLNYGDFLRALITADLELVTEDPWNYRVAFINAFRKRGIFPPGISSLSVETLCYTKLDDNATDTIFTSNAKSFLRGFKQKLSYETNREDIFDKTRTSIQILHQLLFRSLKKAEDARKLENLTGLVFSHNFADMGLRSSKTYTQRPVPSVEIHSMRLNTRVGPDGNALNQVVITLAQRARVKVKHHGQGRQPTFAPMTTGEITAESSDQMILRGGCTLIFNLDTLQLSHVIRKPLFDPVHLDDPTDKARKLTLNTERIKMQYRCMYGSLRSEIGFAPIKEETIEPLAALHQPKNLQL